jgi:hypothetical protein
LYKKKKKKDFLQNQGIERPKAGARSPPSQKRNFGKKTLETSEGARRRVGAAACVSGGVKDNVILGHPIITTYLVEGIDPHPLAANSDVAPCTTTKFVYFILVYVFIFILFCFVFVILF